MSMSDRSSVIALGSPFVNWYLDQSSQNSKPKILNLIKIQQTNLSVHATNVNLSNLSI